MEKQQPTVIGAMCIRVHDGKVLITPNKPNPGGAVVIEQSRLEAWLKRIYREEVVR